MIDFEADFNPELDLKLERIVLPHHQVAFVRKVPWQKSPHGELLKKIETPTFPSPLSGKINRPN